MDQVGLKAILQFDPFRYLEINLRVDEVLPCFHNMDIRGRILRKHARCGMPQSPR